MANTLVVIVGSTATGKSALGVRIALEIGGEIVSADSRQVYRYMDIGTGKPSAGQLSAVPHHLIDIVDPDQGYSLALFLRQARQLIDDILGRSKVPLLVGGTGQWVRALLEGWQAPEVPPALELRLELEARANAGGAEALHAELGALDPAAARRIDPRNVRRVVRALEVHRQSRDGSPPGPERITPPFDQVVVGLDLGRERLYRRIDERVDAMLSAGWLEEVRGLLDRGYGLDLPSMSSLGYRELGLSLEGGISLEEAVETTKRRTRRFSRQQRAWFRATDEQIRWFQGAGDGLDGAVDHVKQTVSAP
jgi:tRNA dimethylallyltransferase